MIDLELWGLPLLEAALNTLWQAPIWAAAAWLLARWTPDPASRCWIWRGAMLAAVLTPWLAAIDWRPNPAAAPIDLPVAAPLPPAATFSAASPEGLAAPGAVWLSLLGLWTLGAFFGLVSVARAARSAARLKRQAGPLPRPLEGRVADWRAAAACRRRFRTRTARTAAPAAVGWAAPAVLLPADLDPDAADARGLWLHEAAHLERRDDWLQLAERTLAALLFFNPAVGWMLKQAELEREAACDRYAADLSGGGRRYAATLARLAELRLAQGAALSAAGNRGSLERRIRMLLENRPSSRRLAWLAAPALFIAAVWVCTQLGGVALAQSAPPPAPPAPAAEPVQPPQPAQPAIPPAPPAKVAQAAPAAPPAPPAAPAPKPSPVPQPKPAPVPDPDPQVKVNVERLVEVQRRIQAELQPEIEKLHAISAEMQTLIEAEVRIDQEKLQAMAKELSAEVARSVGPIQAEIAQLQLKAVDGALTKDLEARMKDAERRMVQAEVRLKELEIPMKEIEMNLKIPHEKLQEIEKRMHEQERVIEEKVRKLEREQDPLEL